MEEFQYAEGEPLLTNDNVEDHDTPLDLSRSLLSSRVPVMTLDVPPPTRTLMTPPSEPEERRSVSSDGLSPSDEVRNPMYVTYVEKVLVLPVPSIHIEGYIPVKTTPMPCLWKTIYGQLQSLLSQNDAQQRKENTTLKKIALLLMICDTRDLFHFDLVFLSQTISSSRRRRILCRNLQRGALSYLMTHLSTSLTRN
ncbi:zinc finger protein 45 [Caerostris extrusa]|uniref:Zinc finger protein 45 n=1 Tax=Caerostris extrusa TaxID=172846 RepID=A0AAV4YC06_CAEEX|nr:zinc finger protein 45 [Caerostris extrusa]